MWRRFSWVLTWTFLRFTREIWKFRRHLRLLESALHVPSLTICWSRMRWWLQEEDEAYSVWKILYSRCDWLPTHQGIRLRKEIYTETDEVAWNMICSRIACESVLCIDMPCQHPNSLNLILGRSCFRHVCQIPLARSLLSVLQVTRFAHYLKIDVG